VDDLGRAAWSQSARSRAKLTTADKAVLERRCCRHCLAALRDVQTPVRIVVVNNDGGGIFHFLPQDEAMAPNEFEALLGTPRGLDVAKVAALFGLAHRRLDELGGLPEALAVGTGLIEVRVDRRANVALHERLNEAVQQTLASSLAS